MVTRCEYARRILNLEMGHGVSLVIGGTNSIPLPCLHQNENDDSFPQVAEEFTTDNEMA